MTWRMHVQCEDCPFAKSGKGLHLRKSLHPKRWVSILRELRQGTYFLCHKTTRETGNGTNLVCAGSLQYQAKHNVSSNYQRVCESIEYFREQREQHANTNT